MNAAAVLGLGEAIEGLREELSSAMAVGWLKDLRFELQPIELTVQVVAKKDVNGKVGWNILEVGGEVSSESTQTLKLTLTPWWRNPDGSVTRNFTIADQQEPGQQIGPRP